MARPFSDPTIFDLFSDSDGQDSRADDDLWPPPPADILSHVPAGDVRTLNDGVDALNASMEEGAPCPCCGQGVRLYRRKLNANMVRFLISLVYKSTASEPWVHHSDLTYTGRDYNYIKDWGLAETRRSEDPDKKDTGFWKPTDTGLAFVQGRLRVPSHIYAYNGTCYGFTSRMVTISEALGQPFRFDELLAGI